MPRPWLIYLLFCSFAHAQLEARFSLAKEKYMAGEPVLLQYTVRNVGTQPMTILAADPVSFCSRYLVKVNRTDVPEVHDCGGGFGGSCLSSSATLKPKEARTEYFLVNYHEDMRTPGSYHISAGRELEPWTDPDLTKLRLGPKLQTSGDFDIQIAEADSGQLRSILLPYFADLTGSHDPQRLNLAYRVVERLSSAAVEDVVLKLRDDPRTREIAVPALKSANTPATRKQLAEIATGDTDGRFAAAGALGDSGDRSYWQALRSLSVRQPSGQAGGFISGAARLGGEESLPWLSELLRSPDKKTRADAVYALQLTGSRRAIPMLIDMITDPEVDIQTGAQVSLVQLTHHTFNPRQIVPADTAAAHAAWVQWWSRNSESAPIFKPGEYCGNALPLN